MKVQSELFELEKKAATAAPEEELALVTSRTLKALFPGTRYCLRVIDNETHSLKCLCAEGPLLPGATDRVLIKRHAAIKTGFQIPTETGKVALTDSYHPVFEGGWDGTCTPIVAGGRLYGAINLERPPTRPLDGRDKLLLIMMANQLAVALKNVGRLRESAVRSDFLERALDGANTLVVVIDAARMIRFVNRAVADIIASRPQDVIGTDIATWFAAEERVALKRIIVNTVRGRKTDRARLTLCHRDGRKSLLEVSTAPVVDEDGEVAGIIATGRVVDPKNGSGAK